MEKSLSCRCQFIQNNTLDCQFILLFHTMLTSVRTIAVHRKLNEKEKKISLKTFFLTAKGICTKQHPMTLVYSNKQ